MTEYSKIINQNFDIHIDKTDYYEEQKERMKLAFFAKKIKGPKPLN